MTAGWSLEDPSWLHAKEFKVFGDVRRILPLRPKSSLSARIQALFHWVIESKQVPMLEPITHGEQARAKPFHFERQTSKHLITIDIQNEAVC